MARILIVDDEEEICEFLKELFEKRGYAAQSALTGEDALRLCGGQAFDLAIVDLKLSTQTTGLAVIQFIRRHDPAMKIIVITGYVDAGLKREAEQCGITVFAEKPGAINPDVILPLVARALNM